ncbi:MAG: hypothetical protein RL359_583 [Actinomycetota bacterium]|jgi:hypothetical protein
MNSEKKTAQTRFIVAVSLFAAALISALSLTALGNRTDSYWIAKEDIAPGSEISRGQIALIKVALGESSSRYLSSQTPLAGSFITRAQSAGELIAINDVSDLAPDQLTQQVPVAVLNSDLPSDISIGEAVNIYWVPESTMGGVQIGVPEVVVKRVYIRSIDKKSANFTSQVALTISLIDSQILKLLNATISGRLVIVRTLG